MKDYIIIALAWIVIGVFLAIEIYRDMKQDAIEIGYFEHRGQFYRVTKMDAPR
jgi:hypothetical protein